MTQAELDREVAAKTGESLATIEQRGFVPLFSPPREPEPTKAPLIVDWDEVDRRRFTTQRM